jgi:hypothetical protein
MEISVSTGQQAKATAQDINRISRVAIRASALADANKGVFIGATYIIRKSRNNAPTPSTMHSLTIANGADSCVDGYLSEYNEITKLWGTLSPKLMDEIDRDFEKMRADRTRETLRH